jgi:hypothetical protein
MRSWRVFSTGMVLLVSVLFPRQVNGQNLETDEVTNQVASKKTAVSLSHSPMLPSLMAPQSTVPSKTSERFFSRYRTLPPVSRADIQSSTSFWGSLRELYGYQPLETPPEEIEAAPLPEKVEPIDRSNFRKIERNKGYFLPLGDTLFYYDRSGKSRGYRKATSIYRSAYDRSSVSLGDTSRSSRGGRSPRRDAGRSAQSRR